MDIKEKEMDVDREILELLYRSLDAELTEKQRRRLEAELAGSEEFRREKDRILVLRKAIAGSPSRTFRPGFANRTLARVRSARPARSAADLFFETFKSVFRRIAVVSVLLLVVLAAYSLTHRDLVPKDAVYYASDVAFGRILQLPVF
jgi:anti-sigma factor RsiW